MNAIRLTSLNEIALKRVRPDEDDVINLKSPGRREKNEIESSQCPGSQIP